MHQKLKFDNPFWLQFTIQEMAFTLCTKQSAGGKSQEDKQLKFEPRLDKFCLVETRPYSCFESVNQLPLR